MTYFYVHGSIASSSSLLYENILERMIVIE